MQTPVFRPPPVPEVRFDDEEGEAVMRFDAHANAEEDFAQEADGQAASPDVQEDIDVTSSL